MENAERESENYLSPKQILKKKMLLFKLKKEIVKIRRKIKHPVLTNIHISSIRATKIGLKTLQIGLPFIIAAGLTTGGAAFLGRLPFYRDYQNQALETMKEFDSVGNIRYEQQYAEFENTTNIVNYCSKWTPAEDDFYYRYVETYEISDVTEEQIQKLMNGEVTSISDVLGEPVSKVKETKNNLTDEEIESDSYINAIIYSSDENDCISIKETFDENFATTLLWILLTIVIEALVGIGYDVSEYDYGHSIRQIKEAYPTFKPEDWQKILELKEKNYERLTRG